MRFVLSYLILLSLIGVGGAVLIAPYQINWTQEIDANVSVNGSISAINIDANASRITAVEGNVSTLQTDLADNDSRLTDVEDNLTIADLYNLSMAVQILQSSHYVTTTFVGGPAGNFTVTGIATSDIIRGASYIDFVNDTTVDILGDCGILDADVIEISPTNTSNGSVILFYYNFEMPS